jgi:crotonobetainyl-CoA:carnitine CoA-transferase CaiB-like acyl-CoA transferase
VPYQLFEAKDVSIIVGCNNDDAWRRLCTALQRDDLARDARFATNAERLRHKPELIELLSAIFRARTSTEWVALLNEHHVPCSRINNVGDVVHDAQVAARDLMPAIPHPDIPELRAPAGPFKMSSPPVRTAPPKLGEHTTAILTALGRSDQEIEALRADGVVA